MMGVGLVLEQEQALIVAVVPAGGILEPAGES